MKSGVSYLTLGIGLLTGPLFAIGQTPSPTFVAQAPVTVPPSGVLVTQPPAPVPVPPSGVLVTPRTIERHAVTTVPVKTAQTVRIAKRATPITMRRHVRPAARRETARRETARRETITRTPTVDQSIAAAATPSVVSTAAEEPRNDGIGYEFFLSQFGKAKEAK